MPNADQCRWMFRKMLLSRRLEQAIKAAYLEGKSPRFNMANGPIPGEMHLSDGQEPCAVGVCAHLSAEDTVTATHRPHHVAVAKGVDLNAMVAEIFGKRTGLSGGRGGHMHLFDPSVRFSCSGIVGEGLGPALGAALGYRLRREPSIAVAFVGEGAANQGAFHEVLNLAALWRVGLVVVVEDNAWGISVAKAASTAVSSNADRAAAYGIPGVRVEGNDPIAIFEAAGAAVARARDGGGPSLLELETVRLEGHFMGDAEAYRPQAERDRLDELDPLPRFRRTLIERGVLTDAEADELDAEATEELTMVVRRAREAPEPAPEDALTTVFA